jgi:ribosome maturation factor RimP
METTEELENILAPILDGMGISMVESSIGRHRGDIKVNLVLYKQDGIGLDDLTKAQKIIRPRLELEYDRDNLSLEISSPGLSRVIKRDREYGLFIGRSIRILHGEDWVNGILKAYDGKNIIIEVDGKEVSYVVDEIRKAKLD